MTEAIDLHRWENEGGRVLSQNAEGHQDQHCPAGTEVALKVTPLTDQQERGKTDNVMTTVCSSVAAGLRDPKGSGHRWAVILAGGEGNRLRPLTRIIAGDDRPKQFCPILGRQTLLDQTRTRVRRILDPGHTLVLVTKAHERFYRELVDPADWEQLLAQPLSRGTAPAIANSLLRLRELDGDGVVAILPSDHYFAEEDAFSADLETAFEAAEIRNNHVILLGMTPGHPEVGYGWIEAGEPLGGSLPDTVCHVNRFWEKPSQPLAVSLMEKGCLWNSFVMVGRVETFLGLIERALPDMLRVLEPACRHQHEQDVLKAYSRIAPSDFSNDVLSRHPNDLAVLRCTNNGWNDLGETSRVVSVLEGKGVKPSWAMDYLAG